MVTLLVLVYALSAVLPLIGLARLLSLARREAAELAKAPKAKTPGKASVGQMTALGPILVRATESRPRSVLIDFGLIGMGIVLATSASIASLFLE